MKTSPARAAGLARFALLVAVTTISGCASPTKEDQVAGVEHVCSSCHGLAGRSVSPTFPNLAGQQQAYLETQLKAFRDHTRADPHAHTYMWGMAARLDDPTIAGLAAFYSSQPPATGETGDAADIKAGGIIYEQGNAVTGVPACAGCHGDHAQGMDAYPRLAGQHTGYLINQLGAFAINSRANEMMHENAKNMNEAEIRQIAAFLASQ